VRPHRSHSRHQRGDQRLCRAPARVGEDQLRRHGRAGIDAHGSLFASAFRQVGTHQRQADALRRPRQRRSPDRGHGCAHRVCRGNPGKLNFGSIGANGTDYIAGDVLQKATGTQWTNMPHKSVVALLLDAVAGRIDVAILSPIPVKPFVDSGKLRILAVTSKQRSQAPTLKDIPTVAEQGVADYDIVSWYGYFAPAGTPAEAVRRFNAATVKAVAKPEVHAYLLSQGLTPMDLSPARFAEFYAGDLRKWTQFVRDANIPVE
jgi:hypothetical protein